MVPGRGDTERVRTAERHHWLNTIVGILDGAFFLSDAEQLQVIVYIRRLLEGLRIPERAPARLLPAPVALELASGMYTVALAGPRQSGVKRSVRRVTSDDMVVSVDAWRDALLGMLNVAYPDLSGDERAAAGAVLSEILVGLGVPDRAAAFFPEEVVRAYLASPESRKAW